MSYGLLSLGVQGVRAAQSGLGVVSNNITNVNTPGYTRQVAQFNSMEEGGVLQDSTQRIVDQFINQRLWSDNSRFEAAQAYEQLSSQLDNLLASDSTSLNVKMDDYFAALQAANDDPISLTNRELFLAEADALVRRYHDLDDQLSNMNETINTRIRELTNEINVSAGDIADLNDRIRIAEASGKDAFELKDQRDESIKELASLVDIQVSEQSNGELSIFVGNGQPLVVGKSAYQFSAGQNDFDPDRYDITINIAGSETNITEMIDGGELGGLLTYRRETMDRSLNELGRLAIIFADTMNEQHQKGIDYDGEMGERLFNNVNDPNLIGGRLRSLYGTEGSVEITDSSQLQASDYELVFTGANEFRVKRLSDGKIWSSDALEASGNLSFDPDIGQISLELDGFRLDANAGGPFVSGEKLMISPVRTGAEDIELNVTNGRDLALASPVTISKSVSGDGSTSEATVALSSIGDLTVKDPVELLSGTTPEPGLPFELSYTDVGGWKTSVAGVTVTPSSSDPRKLVLTGGGLGDNELTVTLSGETKDGDVFELGYNFDIDPASGPVNVGVSDNRNGLLMSGLMKEASSLDGNYQDTYGRLVERVGTDTRVAQMDRSASEAVLNNTIAQRESVSGVNLDEEAVRLIQFQQAYQASAQIISASQRIFDSLIQAV
ncbi:flagellar hook-associated protein FlgK [Marinobacterium sp. YM272]|uniref:flagellar hook-associated protein FlgK n=1 Tax=Marinobacterium sp. YM272 TaxID=3421654 RepID=UPI003D7FB0A0